MLIDVRYQIEKACANALDARAYGVITPWLG